MGCGAVTPQNPTTAQPREPNDKRPSTLDKVEGQLDDPELSKIHSLMERKQYKEAVPLLKNYLELNFDKNVDIDGLGNYQAAIGYYECFPYKFYMQGVRNGTYRGTAIDLLNLCGMALRLDDNLLWELMDWYKLMNEEHEDCYQLKHGYAVTISNQGYYDEAIEYYLKTIELKPDFLTPFENIAYIYEYKRIQVSKSMQWAQKALTVDPNSMYAQFVLAKNELDVDQRIRKCKEFAEKFPKYSRAINFVGFVYGQTKKMPQEAIKYHKKAVEALPQFDIGNYNIGMRYQAMQDYKNAIYYYLEGNRFDKDYRLPINKLVPIFIKLKYTEQQINEAIKEHQIRIDYTYYNIGKTYYDMDKSDESLSYYFKAQGVADQLKLQIERLYNSIANTYFKMKNYNKAIEYFNKGIQINPRLDMLYYNMANVYKEMGKIEEAIYNHKKCIEVNPRYAYPYNNLANIYVDRRNYEEAIKCFKMAVKNKSNYVLAMANLGVCYLKIENYREAFNAISRAKELLQVNKKDLSPGNLRFLSQTLQQFDREGEMWRQSGGISRQDRQKLRRLVQSFEKNFSSQYKVGKLPVNIEKMMKKEILQIIRLVADAKFQMGPIDQIYDLVKVIFLDNQEYFHIIPQLFIQYFYNNVLSKNRPILDVQKELFEITKKLSKKTADMAATNQKQSETKNKLKDFMLTHFNPPKQCKVNLFKAAYFNDYCQVYNQIIEVDKIARSHYKQYKDMIDKVRVESKGIPYGVGLKIPKAQQDQFKVILRVFQKMFKKQLTPQRVNKIINNIEKGLEAEQKKKKKINLSDVVHIIMDKWTSEIDEIVRKRKQQRIETTFQITDLLRAKIMYNSTQNLKKALQLLDSICFQKNYKIIEMENRLDKQQTQDVVLKIQVGESVCQLQLAMEQDEIQYHFIHSIYEIERSPLGCIFGSYIYMSKGFHYPFHQNCKDIASQLKNPNNQQETKTLQAAKYIIQNLNI